MSTKFLEVSLFLLQGNADKENTAAGIHAVFGCAGKSVQLTSYTNLIVNTVRVIFLHGRLTLGMV